VDRACLLNPDVEVASVAVVGDGLDALVSWNGPNNAATIPTASDSGGDIGVGDIDAVDEVVLIANVDGRSTFWAKREPLQVYITPHRGGGEAPPGDDGVVCQSCLHERLRIGRRQGTTDGMHSIYGVVELTVDDNTTVPEVWIVCAAVCAKKVVTQAPQDCGSP